MADVTPVIAEKIYTVKVDSNEEALVLTACFNAGPITIIVDGGMIGDNKQLIPPKVYTFNADPFFRRTNHYIASGSLSIRPDFGASQKISITVTFPNMFANDMQPTGGAEFSLNLFSPLAPTAELVTLSGKTVSIGKAEQVVLLVYS